MRHIEHDGHSKTPHYWERTKINDQIIIPETCPSLGQQYLLAARALQILDNILRIPGREKLSFFDIFVKSAFVLAARVFGKLCGELAEIFTCFGALQNLFGSTALSLREWGLVIAAASLVLIGSELEKWLLRRFDLHPQARLHLQ